MLTELRVVVLHGAHGGPDTNWFPWLHAELENQGVEVVRPRFPTPQDQSLEAWFEAYDRAVASLLPAPTILVGHSLGAAMALRLVERAAAPFDGLFLADIGQLGGIPNLWKCPRRRRPNWLCPRAKAHSRRRKLEVTSRPPLSRTRKKSPTTRMRMTEMRTTKMLMIKTRTASRAKRMSSRT